MSDQSTQLQVLHDNVTTLTKGKLPSLLARFKQSTQNQEVLPFHNKTIRNRLFSKFEDIIEELVETRPLLTDQLCSVCGKYEWIIPTGADDLRAIKYSQIDLDVDPAHSNFPTASGAEPVWSARALPSGSLFNLLTRAECRVCMLVLHLLTPLPIKSLLSWSLDQPLSVLNGFCYSMQYQHGENILVKIKHPDSESWQESGTIETLTAVKNDNGKQSDVWKSGKLSTKRFLNSSWIRTAGIDYDLIQYWLRRCNGYHEHCQVSRVLGRNDKPIRLIDVIDMCLVPGTLSYQYFALSYVWGGVERLRATKDNVQSLEKTNALQMRLASIPRTVQDAITVVLNLGHRYLWVDSLCIVQDDSTEKHDQIGMMHEIYSGAYATIVQHSGCNANAGLPGVRPSSRSLIATKAHVGNTMLIAKANYATPRVLSSSIHSTRGWTLQEVLLSTCCLHFFDKHLTFVCAEEWAQDWNSQFSEARSTELVQNELVPVSSRMLWKMNPFTLLRMVDGHQWDTPTRAWLRYFEIFARILTDYTARQLSFDSDILFAFYGLAGAVTRLNGAHFHFGLPSNSFDLALMWVNFGPGERRTSEGQVSYPSWTWAAWTGQSTYNLCDITQDPTKHNPMNSYVRHFFVIENGRSTMVDRYHLATQMSQTVKRCSPYLEVRRGASEPEIDFKKASTFPEGCLHFWAEECPLGQFFKPPFPDNYFWMPHKDVCGIYSLVPSLKSLDNLFTDDHSLVLLSETLEPCNFGDKSRAKFISPYMSHNGDGSNLRWIFNVLIVKGTGSFVERIGFGQIAMYAWLALKRRRRYMRIR